MLGQNDAVNPDGGMLFMSSVPLILDGPNQQRASVESTGTLNNDTLFNTRRTINTSKVVQNAVGKTKYGTSNNDTPSLSAIPINNDRRSTSNNDNSKSSMIDTKE